MYIDMKLCLLFVVSCASVLASPVPFYATLDDHLDIEGLLRSPEWVKWMQDCLLERHECDPLSASYKAIIKEMFETGCARCNIPQKHMAFVYFTGLSEKYPDDFKDLMDMYDPDGEFYDVLLDKLQGY